MMGASAPTCDPRGFRTLLCPLWVGALSAWTYLELSRRPWIVVLASVFRSVHLDWCLALFPHCSLTTPSPCRDRAQRIESGTSPPDSLELRSNAFATSFAHVGRKHARCLLCVPYSPTALRIEALFELYSDASKPGTLPCRNGIRAQGHAAYHATWPRLEVRGEPFLRPGGSGVAYGRWAWGRVECL